MGWVRTNYNFDILGVTFTIGMRRLAVAGFVQESDNPEAMEAWAKRVVRHFRPALWGEDLIIVGVSAGLGKMEWEISVIHPSLPRTPNFCTWRTERLELCAQCGKPLGDFHCLRGREMPPGSSPRVVEEVVCSQECLDAGGGLNIKHVAKINPPTVESAENWSGVITTKDGEKKPLFKTGRMGKMLIIDEHETHHSDIKDPRYGLEKTKADQHPCPPTVELFVDPAKVMEVKKLGEDVVVDKEKMKFAMKNDWGDKWGDKTARSILLHDEQMSDPGEAVVDREPPLNRSDYKTVLETPSVDPNLDEDVTFGSAGIHKDVLDTWDGQVIPTESAKFTPTNEDGGKSWRDREPLL